MGSVATIHLERDSPMGAAYLLHRVAPGVPATSPLAPLLVYEDTLAQSGKRTMRGNLLRAVRILTSNRDASLDYPWARLRSGHLEFVRARLLSEDFSPSIINATLSELRMIGRWSWHLGQTSHEDYERMRCVHAVGREEVRRRPARALEVEEICALFKSCEVDKSLCAVRDAAMMALLYAGGLRREEACTVPIDAYRPRAHTLLVRGKGKRRRLCYFLDGGARRCLNAWFRVRGEWPGTLLAPVTRHGLVLHHPFSVSGLYEALKRRAILAGVEPFTAHDLRRSLGTHLRREGTDLDLVRAILGHRNIATTQIYLMVDETEKRAATIKIKVPFRARGKRGKRKRRRRRKS
jgi:integrase/recombinase XerD